MTYDTTCTTMAEGPEQNRGYRWTLQDYSYHLELDNLQLEIGRVHQPRSKHIDALEILSSYSACRKDVLRMKQEKHYAVLKDLLVQLHKLIHVMKAGEEGIFSRSYVLNFLQFCEDVKAVDDREMGGLIQGIYRQTRCIA